MKVDYDSSHDDKFPFICLISDFAGCVEVGSSKDETLRGLIAKALCQDKSLEGLQSYNYRILGDSFIKYAVSADLFCSMNEANEGTLTKQRATKICSVNIAKIAEEIGLFDNMSNFNVASMTKKKYISKKKLVHCFQTIIGMVVSYTSIQNCFKLLRNIGLLSKSFEEILQNLTVDKENVMDESLILDIEKRLMYQFRNRNIPQQAFNANTLTFQRLEWLGDSVLGK